MDTTVIINLCLLLVTGIGVIVSILAAVDARSSRDQASVYEQSALQAKRAATAAAERGANALERQAAAAEAALTRPDWGVDPVSRHRWKVTNDTGNAAGFVRVHGRPPGHLTVEGQSEGAFFDVGKGASFFIGFGGAISDPSSLDITIDWRSASGAGQSVTFTLP